MRYSADWRTDAFYCYWSRPSHWGVRTERYTLAHFPGTDEFEFYDNKSDPWQMTNQAENSAYGEAITDCKRRLARLVRELDFGPGDYPGAQTKTPDTKGRNPGRKRKRAATTSQNDPAPRS